MDNNFYLRSLSLPSLHFVLVAGVKLVLGRSNCCNLQVIDPSVSRRHAHLKVHQGQLTVTDLHSKNGTFVDEQPVASTSVASGQAVRFGHIRFVVTEADDLQASCEAPTYLGPREPAMLSIGQLVQTLSRAQRRVFDLLVRGYTEKRIATDLHLSQSTVHNHIGAIYRHFEVRSRSELLALFVQKITI